MPETIQEPEFTEGELHALQFLPTFGNYRGGVEDIGFCETHGRECMASVRTGEHLAKGQADSAWAKYLEMVESEYDPFADEDQFAADDPFAEEDPWGVL